MAVNSVVLISPKYAENSQTTQYTANNVSTIIDKFTVTNNTGSNVTFAVNLVVAGDSASGSNKILNRTIASGECYLCPEIVGQLLKPGEFISTLAGTATSLVLSSSGREISG